MALTTGQQLLKYYNNYKEKQISFNKQIIRVLKLMPREVYLKCHGDQFPCVIYSASMVAAKVVANLGQTAMQKLRRANNTVALRFAFGREDKSEPLFFFVAGKITNYTFYNASMPDLYFLTVEYTAKPPDDLIELLGKILEANANFERRKEDRIDINPAAIKALGLESKEAAIIVNEQAKRCIIRDLSFSGAKVLLLGTGEGDVGKTVILQPSFISERTKVLVPGTAVRYEEVVGRSDIGALGIRFLEDKIPMSYKMILNGYLRNMRQPHL